MNEVWMTAAAGFAASFVLALLGVMRGTVPHRLAALPVLTTLAVLMLVCLGYGFAQPSAIDLALALALLSLPGTLLFALFEERWL